jgi:hypothetical protein
MELLEKGVGLQKTKSGPGSKTEAYVVRRHRLQNFGYCLLACALLFMIIGLSLKSEVSVQQARMVSQNNRVKAHKKMLFNLKRVGSSNEEQKEAKLVKILTVLQDHLSRDHKTEDMVEVFKLKWTKVKTAHESSIDTSLKELAGNKQIVTYLKKLLLKSARSLEDKTEKFAKRYKMIIESEAEESEQRLKLLTEAVRKELSADVVQEKHQKKEMKVAAKADPDWKKMEDDAKKTPKKETQDEKDVETVIENFKEKIEDIKDPGLSGADLATAKQIVKQLDAGGMGKENEMAGQMRAILKKHFPDMVKIPGEEAEAKDGKVPPMTTALVDMFRGFVTKTKFVKSGEKAKLEKELKSWEKNKVSDVKQMLDIEKGIKEGEVDPEWLHDNESQREGQKMLEMGQEDHAENTDVELPKPEKEDAAAAPAEGETKSAEDQKQDVEGDVFKETMTKLSTCHLCIMGGYGWCKSSKKCTHDSPEVFTRGEDEEGCKGGAVDFVGFAANNNQALVCPGVSEAELKEEKARLDPGDMENEGKPEEEDEGEKEEGKDKN